MNFSLTVNRLKKCTHLILMGIIFFATSTANAGVATVIGTGMYNSCAAMAGGGLKCWGGGSNGELGDGKKTSSLVPVEVSGLSGSVIIAVGGGYNHTCALTSTGTVYCWGKNNYGQLASSTLVNSTVPILIPIPTGPAQGLSVGDNHVCALDIYGNVYCWGGNTGIQLNRNPSLVRSTVPIYSAGMNDIAAINGNGMTTCARDVNSGVKCFGYNFYGQLGIGVRDTLDKPTYGAPNYVVGLSKNVISTSAGLYHSCAVSTEHVVSCWGANIAGGLGFLENLAVVFPSPIAVKGIRADANAVFVGNARACITTVGGTAQCWGRNPSGQLGNGRTATQEAPYDVIGISEKVVSISLGFAHTCVLLESGTVRCFGANNLGQLGIGTTAGSPIARPVSL